MAAVALVQGMQTASYTVIAPTLPLVLPELGVHDPAHLRAWIGVLMGITPLMAAFTSPLWGNLADQIGRGRIIMLCCLGNAIIAALMSLAQDVPQLLGLRIAMGCLSGFSAAGMALVAGAAPAQLTGMLCGPVAGGLVADLFDSARAPFLFTAAMSLLAAGLVVVLVPRQASILHDAPRRPLLHDLAQVFGSQAILPLFIGLLLTQLAVRSADPAVVLTARHLLGDVGSMATLAGFAVSAAGLGNLMASPFLGRRSDLLGHRRVLLFSFLAAAAATLPQAFVLDYRLFVLERFFAGAFVGGLLPTLNALVGRSAGERDRGAVYGVTASAGFFGGFLGPILGGFLGAALGLPSVFVMSSVLMLAGFLWILATVPRDPRE